MDMEKMGNFLTVLRKEKGFTQKQLAGMVGVTDKAVSKWERGLSLPDTALLIPLAEALGVTVTELLQGNRIREAEELKIGEVEKLVSNSIELSAEEDKRRRSRNRKRFVWYALEVITVLLELWLIRSLGISAEDMGIDLAVAVSLPLIFGLWFFFFIRETLPSIYDKEKINFYSDGVFQLNIAGVHFNNRNWPYILKAGRLFCGMVPVAYPLLYLLLRRVLTDAVWEICRLPVTLTVLLGGLFIPMIIAGKKFE